MGASQDTGDTWYHGTEGILVLVILRCIDAF